MSKDHFERKAYRRSPGRQYDYDPLNSQNRNSSGSGSIQNRRGDASQAADRWPSNGEASRRTSGLLAPRQNPPLRSPAPRRRIITRRLPEPRYDYPEEYDEYEEDEYVEEPEEPEERPARPRPRSRPRPRRKSKKGGLTRRKLLVGAGVVAVGGLAAYELGPKIPQALHDAGTNIEHQIEDAYNKGLAAGAEAVRKEFIAALTNMEGISLTGATNAARLTRLAYDAFVSPVVNLAATVTGDFLNITLRTLIQGRGWLARINQDNDTLAALQTVLETWSKRVKEVPKEWQTIADSDLDAAQAYLRALQRKIQEEQAKVNNPQSGIPTNVPKAP